MESTNHPKRTPFEEYMVQRREREQQLLSRMSAALAALEALFPDALRYHTRGVDPYAVLQRIASIAQDNLVPCKGCTPFVEALLYLERQYITIFKEQDDRLQRLEAKFAFSEKHELDIESLQDAYDALKDAHDTLQLEYQDLETVYHASLRASKHHKEEDVSTSGEV